MSKEAMKLTLEALERALSDDRPYIVQCKEAITAIRSVLNEHSEALAEQPAQQEPVAKVIGRSKLENESVSLIPRIVAIDQSLQVGTMLYTSPQAQRKPLTDEEIKRMAAPLFMSHYWNLCNEFARAIEAAHGIKEQQ